MPKKVNFEHYIDRAKQIHNDVYDYTLINPPLTTHDKVNIICKRHGVFAQLFGSHLQGRKCPKCNWDNKKQRRIEQLIRKANHIHDRQYDYSLVKYTNALIPVTIICKKHGQFNMRMDNHVYGKQKCPLCGSGKKRTTADFIVLAQEVHGDRYDYSKSIYKNATTKINIVCKEHGEFQTTPDMHCFSGKQGCPSCTASTGERITYKVLRDIGITNFICEHSFSDCVAPDTQLPLWFDFFLPDFNILIEYDGHAHYMEVNFSGNLSHTEMKKRLKRTKYLDEIKNVYAKNNNIKLIRIPYWELDNIENILRNNIC